MGALLVETVAELDQQPLHFGHVHRLDEMVVKAGIESLLLVLILAVTSHGYKQHPGSMIRSANPARNFVPIHAGKADVHHDGMR